MFIKTSDSSFKCFGNLIRNEIDNSQVKTLIIQNKSINTLNLTKDNSTYIDVKTGIVMILVSYDSKNIKSFIINRKINIKKNIYFNLISISDESEISIIHNNNFECIHLNEDYRYNSILPSLNITEIHTKFYQEKGTNYLFKGESHKYWELTYVDKGSLFTSIDNKIFNLKQGDLIFYAPSQFHTQSTLNNTSSYLSINFSMDFNNNILCNRVFTLERKTHSIISMLIEELCSNDIYSNDLSICYLKQLIIQIIRYEKNLFKIKPTTQMQQVYENKLLNEILSFISENINDVITVKTICEKFCISTSTIHSLFKKNTNNTVKNYINELKLNKSKELIKNSSYTISEISEIIGFSSIHYFSKKFKSRFGVSPREYSKSIYD